MKPKFVIFARNPFRVRGFHSRTAALIASVAISTCMAVRLNAEVIDDFEGAVKFAGNNRDFTLFDLTGGQLVISGQAPGPFDPNHWIGNYDNVYWPASLPPVSLQGRTLEVRVDLVRASADDVFLMFGPGGPTGYYYIIIDQNEIALAKGIGSETVCFWTNAPITNQNITVVLAHTLTNDTMLLTTKAMNKSTGQLLFERSFLDGPGVDAQVPVPPPKGIPYYHADPGAPLTNLTYVFAGVMDTRTTLPQPPALEVVLDNLEYDVYYPPHLEIAQTTNGVDLNWRLPMEEHIVVQADQLAGPWCPCPQPYTQTADGFCLTMSCQSQQKFFKLVPGIQFSDDFSTVVPTWTPWFQEAGEEWAITNGVMQVSYVEPDLRGFALCPLGATNIEAVLRDFCASVDTLDWVTSGANWSTLGLFGRGRVTSATAYFAGIGLNYSDAPPGHVMPWIHNGSTEIHGSPFDMATNPPPYRVQFSGVGNRMLLQVLSLTTGEVIRAMPFTNSAYATGVVGLWFNGRNNAGDYYTNIVDNFIVTGTR